MSETHSSLEGVIKSKPEDWEERRLGDLFKQRKEKNRPDLPLLAVTGAGGVVPRDSLERRDTSNADKSKYLRVCEGDIAYNTMRMWQGVSGLSPHEGIVSPAYTICQPVNDVSSSYMSQLFKLPELIQVFHRNSQGLVDDTLNLKFENFSPIRIPVPPLPEQQKIAAILSSVDDVIEKKRAQIDKLKDLKTGMMQELLTKGIGHTAFKDSPVGRIPEGWLIREVQEILDGIIDYRGKSPPKSEKGIPLITAKNIRQGYIDAEPREFIFEEQYDSWMVRGTPKEGDVFITTEAPLGNVAKVPGYKFAIGQRVLALCPSASVDTDYLLYVMQSQYFREQLDLQSTGSTVAGIKQSTFRKILLAIPPLEEQKEIVKPMNALVEREESSIKKLDSLLKLKKALMQDLLTGKVRVNVDNKENAVA